MSLKKDSTLHREILVSAGPDKGQKFSLPASGKVVLGRGEAASVRLNDPRISRVHCTLEMTPESLMLHDSGSTGGTFVDGQRIEKQRLDDGNVIQIGETQLTYRSGEVVAASRTAKPPKMSAKSLENLVGQTLGHFKLDRVHHNGSTAILYMATDLKHTRPVLVKVMLPSITADEEQRTRFVRAVHAMINVRHDNLVEIYGAGKQGPFCWCAMEYVDGISILEVIELVGTRGRLDWSEIYRIAVHIARALEHAHEQKVIHRNVTPDNLLQRKNDKLVKLCDLMLAKGLEGTQARQVTAPGQLVGNVSYMSPERMVDTASLDWRSDQYSLGATLFALITGAPPFQAKSLPELVNLVRSEIPKFPADVEAEVPADFRNLVLKMLSKKPADRIGYPAELLHLLGKIGQSHDMDADVSFRR